MTKRPALQTLLILGAIAIAGCPSTATDDDDDGPTPSACEVAPCGGDLVGSWEQIDDCGLELGLPDCESGSLTRRDPPTTFTFDGDGGGVTESEAGDQVFVLVAPPECRDGMDCAAYEAELNRSGGRYACVPDADACRCEERTAFDAFSFEFTYTVDDTVVTTVDVDSDFERSYAFCAQADSMTWDDLDLDAPPVVFSRAR